MEDQKETSSTNVIRKVKRKFGIPEGARYHIGTGYGSTSSYTTSLCDLENKVRQAI